MIDSLKIKGCERSCHNNIMKKLTPKIHCQANGCNKLFSPTNKNTKLCPSCEKIGCSDTETDRLIENIRNSLHYKSKPCLSCEDL